jgi:hypothetical protein
MSGSTNYNFPLIAESQSNKYLTHNDAIQDIDATIYGLSATETTYSKAQRSAPVALTDATTIAIDLSLSNNFSVTLGGNRTLGNPTNVNAGQAGQIVVKQDGTGSRTLAYSSDYKFPGGTAPTLTTTAGATDILSYYVVNSTFIAIIAILNVS